MTDIKEVLVHFNYFKKITMDLDFHILNMSKFNEHENNPDLLVQTSKSDFSISKAGIEKIIKDKEDKIHFLRFNSKKDTYCFRFILFLNKPGSVLKKLYFGIEFNNKFKNVYKQNDQIIDYINTDYKNNYYVLNDDGYPFFLLKKNDEILSISDYSLEFGQYDINEIIENLDKYKNDNYKQTKYNVLVENSSINPDIFINIDTKINDIIILNFSQTNPMESILKKIFKPSIVTTTDKPDQIETFAIIVYNSFKKNKNFNFDQLKKQINDLQIEKKKLFYKTICDQLFLK